MHRSRALLVTAVALLVVSPAVAAGAVSDHEITGHPGIDVSVPDTDFQPGQQTTLDMVVLNDGNVTNGSLSDPQLEADVTTARAVRVDVGTPQFDERETDDEATYPSLSTGEDGAGSLTVKTNERAIARLPDGASTPVSFRLEIDRDAQPGTYEVPVNISYNYTQSIDPRTSEYNRTSEWHNRTVDVTVEETAQFRVADVESTTRIGATGTVDVTLRNTGTATANNASVALDSQSADLTFGAAASSTRYVGGEWAPGENRTVSYRVSAAQSASQQRYAFGATVDYENDEGTPVQSSSISLGLRPEPEQTFTVVDSESDLAVDSEGPVTLTIRNDGPIDVRDASVTITSESSALVFGGSASASQYIGSWAPGETREVGVEATATTDAESRSYSLQASVGYEDREGDTGQSGTLQFGASLDPEAYEFRSSNVSSSLRVGEEGTLSGTITNVGDRRADSVVIAFESESQNVSPLEQEYSVGRLNRGQSKDFSFDIEISEGAEPGPKQFTLRPSYRNTDDERRQAESFDVRRRVGQQRDTFGVSVTNNTIERGGGRVVEVTVTNAGDDPVSDVSAAVFADDPVTVDDGEAFASEIAPGDSETFAFDLSAGGDALTKSYPIEMDFEYDDSEGDTTLSSGYRFAVDVTEPDDSAGSGLPVVVIGVALVAVVAAVGGYFRYGR